MSSALVRQALEFVDPEENDSKRGRRRKKTPRRLRAPGQDRVEPYKYSINPTLKEAGSDAAEENIKKLLALSTPAVDSSVAEKIIERAIKGKPLAEKIIEKKEEGKSILFDD